MSYSDLERCQRELKARFEYETSYDTDVRASTMKEARYVAEDMRHPELLPDLYDYAEFLISGEYLAAHFLESAEEGFGLFEDNEDTEDEEVSP